MKKAIKYCQVVALCLVVVGCSKSIKDSGHKGVQLWKDGPYWAETNVGAEKPWEFGYYFWWGDTVGYKREGDAWVASNGSSSNYKFDELSTLTYSKDLVTLYREGWTGKDGILLPEHDAAHVHWGGKWRMPTERELEDLRRECDWTWGTMNGVNGYVVRGRGDYATASIFLPAAGCGIGTFFDYANSRGYYWSSVPYLHYSVNSCLLYLCSDYSETNRSFRRCGESIRPVQGSAK